MPTWNRLAELLRAVESVVAQTFVDWELIVVDDGSREQASIVSALAAIGDERIVVHALPEHHNAAYARNVGIRVARGRWISFLDSDDYFLPNKLACVFDKLQSLSGEPKLLLYSSFIQKTVDRETVMPSRGVTVGERIGDYLFVSDCTIGTPGIVLTNGFANEILFNERCIKHQDYDFLLRAEAMGAVVRFIEEPLWVREFRASEHNVGASFVPAFSSTWYNDYCRYLSASARLGFLEQAVVGPMLSRPWRTRFSTVVAIASRARWPVGHLGLLISTLLPYEAFHRRFSQLKANALAK